MKAQLIFLELLLFMSVRTEHGGDAASCRENRVHLGHEEVSLRDFAKEV